VDWKPRVTVTFQRKEPVLQGAQPERGEAWGTSGELTRPGQHRKSELENGDLEWILGFSH